MAVDIQKIPVELRDNKTFRSFNVGKCKLTVRYIADEKTMYLSGVRLESKFRGTGEATKALTALMHALDTVHEKIRLEVQPMDKKTNFEGLVRLYSKFGFKKIHDPKAPAYYIMERKPKKVPKMSLKAISRELESAGVANRIVIANSQLIDHAWKKIVSIFGYRGNTLKILEDEVRGGNRIRATNMGSGVIEYGIWEGGIHVVDGMINADCVLSVVESAIKKIEKAFKQHQSLRERSGEAVSASGSRTAVQTPDGWDAALKTFVAAVQKLEDTYVADNGYKHLHGLEVICEDATKFTKVILKEPQGNRRIYCFVDRSNGDILKPATFTVPAKGARGNIFDADHGMKRMGPNGPAYNK